MIKAKLRMSRGSKSNEDEGKYWARKLWQIWGERRLVGILSCETVGVYKLSVRATS